MKDFPFVSFIVIGVFCVGMSLHMHLDWHFEGMSGVFAVIAAIAFCNVYAADPK